MKELSPFEFTFTYMPKNGCKDTYTKMYGSGTLYITGKPILMHGNIQENNFKVIDENGNEQSAKGATSKDSEDGVKYFATFYIYFFFELIY